MKRIINCLMIIIGTLIGAGFASGREIATFFNRFLDKGIWGIIISSVLFAFIVFSVLRISQNKLDYKGILKNNKYVIIIIKSFAFICFCIMISAIGTLIREEFNVPFYLGIFCSTVFCFMAFLNKFNGLEKINNILVPIILVGIVFMYLFSNDNYNLENGSITDSIFLSNWIQASLLYVGYNSILLIPILFELKKYNLTKENILFLSALAGTFICISGLLIYYVLNKFYPNVLYTELPTLFIVKNSNNFIYIYYSIVIIFAIFTTAFSAGYTFLNLNDDKNYFRNCFLMCFTAIALAKVGFANLVDFFFPIFGYFGIFQAIYVIYLGNKKNYDNI